MGKVMATKSIVIAEHGTDWTRWARKLRTAENVETVVLMQDQQETPEVFAKRALSRVATLMQSGVALSNAVFLSGEMANAAQRRQRSSLVRSLSSLLSRAGDVRLYLEPAGKPSRAAQRMMQALAWTVNDLTRGTGLTVLVVGASSPLLN